MSKAKPSVAPKPEPKTKSETVAYPSLSTLGLPDHLPEAIDLRPYTPAIGETHEHAIAAALVALFARTGRPLPFVPSPEHLAAIGVDGIGKYGVRENGVRMGSPPTEYDLTADSSRLDLSVFAVDSEGDQKIKDSCAAFAAGHAIRAGDHFVVAYRAGEITLTNGSTLTGLDDREVWVWAVTRP